ncbi:MAG: hypothetical protein DRP72_02165 [Candidatus Omnitrophota bacterium]|nr:MAG: hypothetical protein DRP72_02165 [Candidatus Omnitrophota bacterium]
MCFLEYFYKIFWYFYPFSLENLISKELGQYKIIADLGCGDGSFLSRIKNLKCGWISEIIGFDIFMPALIRAKEKKIYRALVQGDIRKLPFKKNSFDVVLISHVIEHVEKNEKYIKNLEGIARNKIIFITPNGYTPNLDKSSIYQTHSSGYTINDFKHLRYIVRGLGCRIVCGKVYKAGKLPSIIRPLFSLVSLIFTCITYYYPRFADHLICIKTKY